MEFYFKSYSQSKFGQNLFLNKTRKKENASAVIRLRSRENALGVLRLHLNKERALRGSLTVGREGPLVRFDRSFPPSLLFCPTGAGLRRSPATDGGSSRGSAGGNGTARPRRSFGWLKGRRRWKESPAASSSAGEGYGGEVTIVLRWSLIEDE